MSIFSKVCSLGVNPAVLPVIDASGQAFFQFPTAFTAAEMKREQIYVFVARTRYAANSVFSYSANCVPELILTTDSLLAAGKCIASGLIPGGASDLGTFNPWPGYWYERTTLTYHRVVAQMKYSEDVFPMLHVVGVPGSTFVSFRGRMEISLQGWTVSNGTPLDSVVLTPYSFLRAFSFPTQGVGVP
jgi:hypothetical protein